PLAPAKPGEPIYRRPVRPGGGPLRPAGPPAVPGGFPPAAPGRRGPHPVRGRPAGPPSRAERERDLEQRRERALRAGAAARAAAAPIVVDREVTITEGITVKDLSEKLGVKARDLIRRLLDQGVVATINHTLDPALAEQVAQSFGARTRVRTFEEEAQEQVTEVAAEGRLVERAPVVTVMGHVDHGKTSLLDAIRETNVTEQEAGGITQHIGAYTVTVNGRKIVFLDTPGHEAFTRMRARGAKVTDVVVLVVAADDGVMPQTLEAISHARDAKVPIIVAINKIDKPGALPERVKKQLSEHGLVAEDWGGDTVMVEVSAKQKTNLQTLLEMILLVTEIQELKANPDRPASGTVLEAKLDKNRGPVCSLLVQNGTLRVGDSFLVGAVFGKVRAMFDDRGHPIEEAPPSTPVEILGLQSLPQAGDSFQAVTDAIKAKQIALYRESKLREISLAKSSRLTLEQFQDQMKAGLLKELPIILKADVQGSAEVIAESLNKLGDERVKVKLVYTGVGAITVSDVLLASASNSIIVGFNVRPERKAAELALQEQVEIRLHTVIYELMDEMRKALTGLLEPTHREVPVGRAEVRQTFRVAKVGTVAGSVVSEGRLTKDCSVRLLRDNVVVYQGRIASLRRFKDDVAEVRSGLECGVTLENFSDIKAGDVIEAFVTERVAAAALA
ncbi:MAG TPA: translation initiation factor IF-2, partial [Terriglobia bacterium]|nr:translation initiation factor IF-2 [Terriglobia bacterium]